MRKSNEINTFRDQFAKVEESTDEKTGLPLVTVLYGARDDKNMPIAPDENDATHGTWMAIQEGKTYNVVYWKRAVYEGADLEINDLERIQKTYVEKKAIVDEAVAHQDETDWNKYVGFYKELMEQWRKLPHWHLAFEDEFWDQFHAAQSHFYDAYREEQNKRKVAKEDIVRRAQEIAESEDYHTGFKRFQELMKEWKAVGPAYHRDDEALWKQFRAYNDQYHDKVVKHQEDMQPVYEASAAKKRELIEKTKEIVAKVPDLEWKATSDEMNAIMDEWRAAGNSGKVNDDLWKEFQDVRKVFYDARKEFYASMNEKHAANAKAKKALIQEAKQIASTTIDFTKETTDRMKELQQEWKAIGSCGHKKENELWKQFREAMDAYFENRRQFKGY